jgi:hypothetical protein
MISKIVAGAVLAIGLAAVPGVAQADYCPPPPSQPGVCIPDNPPPPPDNNPTQPGVSPGPGSQ